MASLLYRINFLSALSHLELLLNLLLWLLAFFALFLTDCTLTFKNIYNNFILVLLFLCNIPFAVSFLCLCLINGELTLQFNF